MRRGTQRILLLLVLAGVVGSWALGSRGLYDSTEGRYAEVAREMLESGDFLEPTLGHEPHWTKPPLTYWAIAAGIKMLGLNSWAARLFNVIALCVTVLAVYGIGAALWDWRLGFAAGLIYLSSPFPVAGAAIVSADNLLTMWEVLTVLAYVEAFRSTRGARGRLWILAMWLFLGLGFLTKGPPALLPLLVLVIFHVRAGRPFRLADPAGLIVFALSAFSWYALVIHRHPELLQYFVGYEIVGRNLTGSARRSPEWYAPLVLYLPALILGSGLWTYDWLRNFGRGARRRLVESLKERRSAQFLMLLWIALPLAVFCVSRSRQPLYILPLYPPIALVIARGFMGEDRRPQWRRLAALTFISIALVMASKTIWAHQSSYRDMERLARAVQQAGGDGAQNFLVEETGVHGLFFYLDGNVERVSMSPQSPWADATLEQVVERIAAADGSRPYVFITSKRWMPDLARALCDDRFSCRTVELIRRELLIVRQMPDAI